MKESKIERHLKNRVEAIGGLCIKFVPMHFAGFPDRMCLMPGGLIFFAELKAPGKTPRKLQTKVICMLRKLGFNTYAIDSYKDIDSILKTYENTY